MKMQLAGWKLFVVCLLALGMGACHGATNPDQSPDGANGDVTSTSTTAPASTGNYQIKGAVQKGPFVLGADITVYELNESLAQTGKIFNTKTTDHSGSFTMTIEGSNPLVEIVGNGYYFNEIDGQLSTGPLTLRALVDLRAGTSVNLNVLTTLASGRIRTLVAGGTPLTTAASQAATEILAAFGIPDAESFRGFSGFNLSADGDNNAVLLAASVIVQRNGSPANIAEWLARFDADLAPDGVLGDQLQAEIRSLSKGINTQAVRQNLIARYNSLSVGFVIPPFENYLDVDGNGTLDGSESLRVAISPLNDNYQQAREGDKEFVVVSLFGPVPSGHFQLVMNSDPSYLVFEGPFSFDSSSYQRGITVSYSMASVFGNKRTGDISIRARVLRDDGSEAANGTLRLPALERNMAALTTTPWWSYGDEKTLLAGTAPDDLTITLNSAENLPPGLSLRLRISASIPMTFSSSEVVLTSASPSKTIQVTVPATLGRGFHPFDFTLTPVTLTDQVQSWATGFTVRQN